MMMTLEEVEKCDYAYLIYDDEDPDVHCFLRLKTYDEFISFDRPLDSCVHSQPHLWKDKYGSSWAAYPEPPNQCQINAQKRRIRKERRW